jgi:hypothetical protein
MSTTTSMSAARRARLYRRSRELWKQRCADKQEEIRYLRVKVRDLEASRLHWKEQAVQNRMPPEPPATTSAPPEPHLGGA